PFLHETKAITVLVSCYKYFHECMVDLPLPLHTDVPGNSVGIVDFRIKRCMGNMFRCRAMAHMRNCYPIKRKGQEIISGGGLNGSGFKPRRRALCRSIG